MAAVLRTALVGERPAVPARFLYDELGSRLFDAITLLPEYYPTRTEAALLQEHLPAIAAAAPVVGATLIDLGAGNCEKAARLFPVVRPEQYVAVDISVEFLRVALRRLQFEHPQIDMLGVGTDFSRRLELPAAVRAQRRLFFYPGSSIGNFTPDEATGFLRRLRAHTEPDSVLWIGVDLQKPREVLERAYDDELGVTAAFNRNLLRHVNRLAGTNFVPADWRHIALYAADRGRVEMHLEATHELQVTWPGGERRFAAGDRIHTENSYKYTRDSFAAVLQAAGFTTAGVWTDAKGWFAFFAAVPAGS